LTVVYDGVVVPGIVKDDYLYRVPCPAGSELLFRFANLTPGKYNVTVFMGRTSDTDGQFGKIWVDDINGKKEPTAQNTGDFGGMDLAAKVPIPTGQPRTVTVDIKAGDYLWYGYMEDSSGGISGMIIRGITGSTQTTAPSLSFANGSDGSLTLTYTGTLYSSDTVKGTYTAVAGATSPFKLTPKSSAKKASFFRSGQ